MDTIIASESGISPAEIRAQRRILGLKQAALADLLDVDQATISRWERGLAPIEQSTWSKFQSISSPLALRNDWSGRLADTHLDSHWPTLLKHFRLIRRLNQEQFAELSGYAPESISRWESGRFLPSLAAQRKLRDLILSPLDSNRQLRQLIEWVDGSAERMTVEWGMFMIACSPGMRRTQAGTGYTAGKMTDVRELHEGIYLPWLDELRTSGFFRAEAPMTTAKFRYSSIHARRAIVFAVPLDDGNLVSLGLHQPCEAMGLNRSGEFKICHADEMIN